MSRADNAQILQPESAQLLPFGCADLPIARPRDRGRIHSHLSPRHFRQMKADAPRSSILLPELNFKSFVTKKVVLCV